MRTQRRSPRRRNSWVIQNPFFSHLQFPRTVPTARAGLQPVSLHPCVALTTASWELPEGSGKPPTTVPGTDGGGFLPPPFATHMRPSPDPSAFIPHSSKLQLNPLRTRPGSDPVWWHSTGLQKGVRRMDALPASPPLFCQPGLKLETPQISSRICLSGSALARTVSRCAGSPANPPWGPGRCRRCVRRSRGQTAARVSAV